MMDDFVDRVTSSRRCNFLIRSRINYLILQDYPDRTAALVKLMEIVSDPSDLILMGMLLRFGADPNHYIDIIGSRQRQHIISYALEKMEISKNFTSLDPSQFSTLRIFVLALLITAGSDPALPRIKFCPDINIDVSLVRNIDRLNSTPQQRDMLNREEYQSLQAWLGPQPILRNELTGEQIPLGSVILLLTETQIRDLQLMLDIPGNSYTLEQVIASRATRILESVDISAYYNLPHYGGYSRIWYYLIKARCLEMGEYFLKLGIYPVYSDVNLIITEMFDKTNVKDDLKILYSMLYESLRYGADIDSYQWKTLDKIDIEDVLRRQLLDIYQKPYLNKMALAPKGLITHRLLRYAFDCNLSLEHTKAKIVDQLLAIAQTPIEDVLKACKERFNTRITTEFNNFLYFIGDGNIQAIPIAKIHTSGIPPEIIGDHQTIVFEGPDELFYCFASDYFIPLLRDKDVFLSANGQKPMEVPSLAKIKIESKLKLLNWMEIDPTDIHTIPDRIKEMNQNDLLTADKTNLKINTMKSIFNSYGISPQGFEELDQSVIRISNIFSRLDLDMEGLDKLDITHLWATFYSEMYALESNVRTRQMITDIVIPMMKSA